MKSEYYNIVNDIINNKDYMRLKSEVHHYSYERYSHCIDVSYKVYKVCKRLHLDYVSVTRAAVVHDYFFNEEFSDKSKFYRITHHYEKALANACEIASLSSKEKNIISSHMFPIGGVLPRCLESVIVDLIDDVVALKEVVSCRYHLIKNVAYCLVVCVLFWK